MYTHNPIVNDGQCNIAEYLMMSGVQPCCFQPSENPFSAVLHVCSSPGTIYFVIILCVPIDPTASFTLSSFVRDLMYLVLLFCCFVQTEYARMENGRFVYRIHRSPMCEYMINFIHKLKHLPEKYMMNSVLENFTILQVKNVFLSPLYSTPLSGLTCYACTVSLDNKLDGGFQQVT